MCPCKTCLTLAICKNRPLKHLVFNCPMFLRYSKIKLHSKSPGQRYFYITERISTSIKFKRNILELYLTLKPTYWSITYIQPENFVHLTTWSEARKWKPNSTISFLADDVF